MGMFKLIKDIGEYSNYISEFKHQHDLLNPLIGALPLGDPLRYPCLISSIVAFVKKSIYRRRPEGVFRTEYIIEETIINEIYYRPQAKKLVYPSKGQITRPCSAEINNVNDLVQFVRTSAWTNPNIDVHSEPRTSLQLEQINKLYDTLDPIHRAAIFPCIASFKNIDEKMPNDSLITVATFFILTKEEAKSLVYYGKNVALKQRTRAGDTVITYKRAEENGAVIMNEESVFQWQTKLPDHDNIPF